MKKTIIQFVIIAVSIFMVTSAYAAGAGIGQGSNEFFGQAQLANTKSTPEGGSSTTTTTALYTVGYGRFITDPIQLGISHTGVIYSTDNSDSGIMIFDGFAKYHFYSKGQTVVPYVGIQLGFVGLSSSSSGGSDTSGTGFSYGGMGGIKFFLSENFAVNTELNYRHSSMTITAGNSDYTSTEDALTALLGFAIYF
jgi:opacity protein-like surface antigen